MELISELFLAKAEVSIGKSILGLSSKYRITMFIFTPFNKKKKNRTHGRNVDNGTN